MKMRNNWINRASNKMGRKHRRMMRAKLGKRNQMKKIKKNP